VKTLIQLSQLCWDYQRNHNIGVYDFNEFCLETLSFFILFVGFVGFGQLSISKMKEKTKTVKNNFNIGVITAGSEKS
jgi:hypothetical protein